MAAPAPTTPEHFKDILVRSGCVVVDETDFNWILRTNAKTRPLVTVPKKGELVSLGTMMEIMDQIEMDNGTYFKHKKQIES